ncbi:hypothetical protein DFH11DRAFT_188049 [Phellopilus nigrolimitatus]|nr:hypothetical protein DFH11DRAFT_188049 [Phellopilus nigrolimitatus]
MNPASAAGIHHLTVAKQYATASWAVALYEYLITFDREVHSIWQRKFSFATILWVFVYASAFLLCYHHGILPATFHGGICLTFVKFPGTIQIISNISTGLTLSLRVYALYSRAWWIFLIIIPFFIVEIVIESWAVAGGVPVPIPEGQVGCILTGKPTQGDRFAAFWIGQLIFPSLIFVMTIVRVFILRRQGSVNGGIIVLMLRDGVLYFLVIFFVNLANVLTYVIGPPDIQAINAPFSALITAMMICRLMLNLRSAGEPRTTFIGNLGEELDIDNVDNKLHRPGIHKRREPGTVRSERDYELSTFHISH